MFAPTITWTLETWLQFLLGPGGTGLAELAAGGNYHATEKGQAFVSYVDGAGYPARLF